MAEYIPVYDVTGIELDKIEKPVIFKIPVREDIIRKIFVFQHSHRIQPKGRYPLAGMERSAEFFGVGLGLARVPRIKEGPLRGTAAIVTMARGGRRHHVTTPEKKVYKNLNKKELRLGVAHAVAATGIKELVEARGHIIDRVPYIPLVVSDDIEEIVKTKELYEALERLGLSDDILRVKNSIKIVGGKASWRGRRKKVRKGPLIVYNEDRGIVKAARNIIGVDVVSANEVSVIHLAPGGHPGRLTLWTQSAISKVQDRLSKYVKVFKVGLYV